MAKTVRFIVVFFILHHLVTDDDVTLSLPTPTDTLPTSSNDVRLQVRKS